MDENLVVHAIQQKTLSVFKNRYQTFESEKTRDETFKVLTTRMDQDALAEGVCRVFSDSNV